MGRLEIPKSIYMYLQTSGVTYTGLIPGDLFTVPPSVTAPQLLMMTWIVNWSFWPLPPL